jgi:hypothetical protein
MPTLIMQGDGVRMMHFLSGQCYKYYLSGLCIVVLRILEYLVGFQHQRSNSNLDKMKGKEIKINLAIAVFIFRRIRNE